MSSVDSRIVTMKFDNAAFEKGAQTTLGTLGKLKSSLDFGRSTSVASKGLGVVSSALEKIGIKNPFAKATAGVSDLQANTNKFSTGPMVGAVTGVSKSFVAMSTVAITAIANVTTAVQQSAAQMVKSMTIAPIKDGYDEYGIKLSSIQTIMAATGKSTEVVTKKLEELNAYSDLTIYSFKDMIDNIPKFTNAGVDLNTSVKAIQGIAQVAAVSGANTNEAARAMYNFGQALGAGHVKLIDWKSIELANMGTVEFKEQLLDAAVAAGTLTKSGDGLYKTLEGTEVTTKNFGQTLQDQWLTSEALVSTLEKYTDETTELGKKAYAAATDVKTLTQLMDIFKESIGSGWATSFEMIFGNLDEAKELWGSVDEVVGGFIRTSAEARNKVLGDWKALGGRTLLIEGIAKAFYAVMDVITPIRKAFRDIFPKMTGERLFEITAGFRNFTEHLSLGEDTMDNIRRTFRGFFAVLSIGWQIVKGVAGVFLDLFFAAEESGGGILEFTGTIGDFLVALDKAIKEGGLLNTFFDGLGTVLSIPIKILGLLGSLLAGVFSGFDEGGINGISDAFGRMGDRLSPLASIGDSVTQALERLGDILGPLGERIGQALSGIGSAIASGMSSGDFEPVLDLVNTALLGGILLLVKRFFSEGLNIDFGGGMLSGITDTFGALTDTMKAMQTQIQAKTLLTIAGAIALLTASVVALSLIDSAKLTKALTAMSVGFGQLLAAMAILVKISGAAGFVKVPIIAASMVLLAGAVLILVAAVAALSALSWEQLSKGLAGVGALLAMIAGFSHILGGSALTMFAAGQAMIPLAIGLGILAGVVAIFSQMSWGDMAKGMAGLAGALLIVSGAVQTMGPSILLAAPGLILLSVALGLIAGVMQIFAAMSWEEIGKAMTGLAGSLLILAGALYLMTGSLAGAAALLIITPALLAIGGVMKVLGSLSWSEIGRGLVALGGALLVLALGLTAMIIALPGAFALTVAAKGLAVLAAVLVVLGQLSWEEIGKGLATIAAVFTVLGIAGLLLAPITPIILGLSVALLAVGAGLALAGAGALAFATAFAIFTAAGVAGVAVFTLMLESLINMIPVALAKVGEGIVAFAKVIATGGPAFVSAFATVMASMLDSVIKVIPKIGRALSTLIQTGIRVLTNNIPKMVDAGFRLLNGILDGIEDNIYRITTKAVNIVTKFAKALGDNAKKLTDAAADLIIDFVNALADTIEDKHDEMREAGGKLGMAMADGMTGGLASKAKSVIDGAAGLAGKALAAIGDVIKSNSPSKETYKFGEYMGDGLSLGMDHSATTVERSAERMAGTALKTMSMSMRKISEVVADEVDSSPVITPVLDLAQLQKDATKISGVLGTGRVTADMSYGQAVAISEDRLESQGDEGNASETPVVREIKYEQNNYSPKALSAAEIYRNTRNQLSLAKEALG